MSFDIYYHYVSFDSTKIKRLFTISWCLAEGFPSLKVTSVKKRNMYTNIPSSFELTIFHFHSYEQYNRIYAIL